MGGVRVDVILQHSSVGGLRAGKRGHVEGKIQFKVNSIPTADCCGLKCICHLGRLPGIAADVESKGIETL